MKEYRRTEEVTEERGMVKERKEKKRSKETKG